LRVSVLFVFILKTTYGFLGLSLLSLDDMRTVYIVEEKELYPEEYLEDCDEIEM